MTAQNGFNVAIALLGGSILSRSRGFLLRSLFPLATGLGAAAYFLPNTMYNVDQAWYRCVLLAPVCLFGRAVALSDHLSLRPCLQMGAAECSSVGRRSPTGPWPIEQSAGPDSWPHWQIRQLRAPKNERMLSLSCVHPRPA